MKRDSLVSVVTPFFNAAQFLPTAIESVLAQTYDRWELLLVDDGSDDGGETIARRYAALYPDRIRYLTHRPSGNRGKSVARNLGIRHARGELLALLDADDIFLPQKLERQQALLAQSPDAVMVYGPTEYWHGWTGKASDARMDRVTPLGIEPDSLCQPPDLITLYLQNPAVVPGTCGLLARREAAVACGGFDEAIQNIYEDQVFFARLCLHGPVLVDGDCWSKYRQHPDSSCHVARRQGEYHPYLPNPARQTYLDWLGTFLRSQKVDDDRLWSAYSSARRPYRYPRLYRRLGPVPHFAQRVGLRLNAILRNGRLRENPVS